jgi:hypothetical protein
MRHAKLLPLVTVEEYFGATGNVAQSVMHWLRLV